MKRAFLDAVLEAKSQTRLSVEDMARNAGCAVSAMSDALSGKNNRTFAGHWVLSQGQQFVDIYNREVDQRLGLTPGAKKAVKAKALGELVRQIAEAM